METTNLTDLQRLPLQVLGSRVALVPRLLQTEQLVVTPNGDRPMLFPIGTVTHVGPDVSEYITVGSVVMFDARAVQGSHQFLDFMLMPEAHILCVMGEELLEELRDEIIKQRAAPVIAQA